MNDDYLRLSEICHYFADQHGERLLFDRLSLTVKKGSVVSIVGASGVGKTTLFNIVAGLIAPSQGAVWIDGYNRTNQTGFSGYMLQKDLLLPFKTIFDNIALPLTIKKTDKGAIQKQIAKHLEQFGLVGLLDKYPHQLSGGQRQRAALLRTYLSNNELMLLDEPFSALDYVTKTQMHQWFANFRQQHGLTCLIITHDIEEAMYLSDEIYVLSGFPAVLSRHFIVPKTADFANSSAFLQLKQQILQAIY